MEQAKEVNKKIVEKVKKLLRLSKSDQVGEAMNALRKAQELMLKYNIVVEEEDKLKDEVVIESLGKYNQSRPSLHKAKLAGVLAKRFRCSWYYTGSVINFIGLRDDVLILKESFEWICIAYEKLQNMHLKERREQLLRWDRSVSNLVKRDYLIGFCKGLANYLDSNCKEKGLMVIVPNAVSVKEKEIGIRYVKSSMKCSYNAIDMNAGERDGFDSMSMKKTIV